MNPCYEVYCYEVLINYFCYEVLVMKYGEIRYITCKPHGIKEEPISNSDIPVNRMIARSDLNNKMVRICVCTIPGTVLVHYIKLMYIIYINLLCLVVMVYLYIDSIYSIFFPLLLVTFLIVIGRVPT